VVPKTDHPDASRLQKAIAHCVTTPRLFSAMRRSVEFQCYARFDAVEIQKIWPTGVLSAELEFRKAPVAKNFPKTPFR
jgi:hypothetical protein